jgi:hypothetical protein
LSSNHRRTASGAHRAALRQPMRTPRQIRPSNPDPLTHLPTDFVGSHGAESGPLWFWTEDVVRQLRRIVLDKKALLWSAALG